MQEQARIKRQAAKTNEAHFLRKLEDEFDLAPRMAQAVLEEAQSCLGGVEQVTGPGQLWVYLTDYGASPGQTLAETSTKMVRWTVDSGQADQAVLAAAGRIVLRQVRIQRLLEEAVEQGALATQEDLAQALHVDVRTIKRDCQALQEQGVWLPLRGSVRGIGRGQSHKAQIIGRWLQGETYDQLMRSTHHSVMSIRRYIQTFVRVVQLHQEGFSAEQVAHLSQCSLVVVQEYLAVYVEQDTVPCRQRLQEQIERVQRVDDPKKGGL